MLENGKKRKFEEAIILGVMIGIAGLHFGLNLDIPKWLIGGYIGVFLSQAIRMVHQRHEGDPVEITANKYRLRSKTIKWSLITVVVFRIAFLLGSATGTYNEILEIALNDIILVALGTILAYMASFAFAEAFKRYEVLDVKQVMFAFVVIVSVITFIAFWLMVTFVIPEISITII
jgi:hypothetical protein